MLVHTTNKGNTHYFWGKTILSKSFANAQCLLPRGLWICLHPQLDQVILLTTRTQAMDSLIEFSVTSQQEWKPNCINPNFQSDAKIQRDPVSNYRQWSQRSRDLMVQILLLCIKNPEEIETFLLKQKASRDTFPWEISFKSLSSSGKLWKVDWNNGFHILLLLTTPCTTYTISFSLYLSLSRSLYYFVPYCVM